MLHHVKAGVLEVGFEEAGDPHGWPAILLHGFPYDIHSYDDVTPRLIENGARVIVPYLRGYGPTRFLSSGTLRSGQQAALAYDLLSLMDALEIRSAVLAGYDWGGRAACVIAALWPARVTGLVTQNGYNIHDIARSAIPDTPENELRYWYQYYFHGERGRAGLAQNRRALCKLLWRLWSPTWDFDEEIYERTAKSFDNPDFVDVVIHSYRHRYALVTGDPALEGIERQLAAQPAISVPTISIEGEVDGVMRTGGTAHHRRFFSEPYEHRAITNHGHNLPQEAP